MADLNNQEQVVHERESHRGLLFFYDLIIYTICVIVLYAIHPSIADRLSYSSTLLQYFLGMGCIFSSRLLFRVYKQIWRYSDVTSYAHLIAGDIVGGAVYIVLGYFLPHILPGNFAVVFIYLVILVTMNTVVCILARLVYFYLYYLATQNYKMSRPLKTFLTNVGFVDFDSPVSGGIMRITLTPDTNSGEAINDIQRVIRQFAIRGEVIDVKQINNGYINRTYRIETKSESKHTHFYTLQRINTNVFKDVDALMSNYSIVTKHLKGRLLLSGRTDKGSVQEIRPTKDGRSYYRDDTGCWRMLTYFNHVYSMDIPESFEVFHKAGTAFGTFIDAMSNMDPKELKIVIPDFHNTYKRYLDLEKAIEEDPVGRVHDVVEEIAFIRKRVNKLSVISDALEKGEIPYRICHNDCNLNNILFDEKTKNPVAIIDLDTVMPSTPLYDFGDSMRIGTNTAKDDEKDLTKVSCSLDLYEEYARGYLEACGNSLTRRELELLPMAAWTITAEDSIRFLTDHINGDTYYNIFYPEQNLNRARTQLRLLDDMERKSFDIKDILRIIYSDLRLDADIL